jgi:hypothetical protein
MVSLKNKGRNWTEDVESTSMYVTHLCRTVPFVSVRVMGPLLCMCMCNTCLVCILKCLQHSHCSVI